MRWGDLTPQSSSPPLVADRLERMTTAREILALTPIGADPEVGRWLAALEDGRRATLKELDGVTPEMVDWYPGVPFNSIGTLLYHIALIEADWVATEILALDGPPEIAALLPWPDRIEGGQLAPADGLRLAQHTERLAGVRAWVLEHLRPMTNEAFHRIRPFEHYDAAPDWVLHHLLQHEAEHRSQIAWLRDEWLARERRTQDQ